MKKYILYSLLFVFLLNPIYKIFAHHPDNSLIYLKIYENKDIHGRFDVCVNELNEVFNLNISKQPKWEEVAPHIEKIREYLIENSKFSSKYGHHKVIFVDDEFKTLPTNFGFFIEFPFYLEGTNQLPENLDITYKAFIQENTNHINLLGIEYNWKAGFINNEKIISLDFSNNNWTKTLSLTDTSIWNGIVAMIKQGVWHIWIGLDHILFILALILPAVVRRKKTVSNGTFNIWGWEPVDKFRPAFIYIVKIITFFTIAHTITLSLASLEIIVLPSQLVESIIALSIGLAAYHNIKPIFKGKDWIIAFVFGLFHGFGFASVLGELGFNGEHLTLSLLGFNIGVEIGQVAIIAGIFPILFLIRKLKLYPKFLVYLSALLVVISMYWLVERAFDIDLPVDDHIRRWGYEFAVWLGLR